MPTCKLRSNTPKIDFRYPCRGRRAYTLGMTGVPEPTSENLERYAGVDPGPTVAPVTCPHCGLVVPPEARQFCPLCNAQIERPARLIEEYGPEVLIPGAWPLQTDLSGAIWVREGALIVLLAAILMILIYRLFGGWGFPAMVLSACYWMSYAVIRRRFSPRAAASLIHRFAGREQV